MKAIRGPFQTQVVSDIERGGLGIELVPVGGMAAAEVFRCDVDHTLSVTTFAEAVPLYALEMLIQRAKVELDPFEDGTPLSMAKSHGA
jgi:hypothetical protein